MLQFKEYLKEYLAVSTSEYVFDPNGYGQENANALKIDNYKGYLKPGYIADMVSFDNDPTLNIRNLETIPNSIIKAGKVIKANGQLIT